jgi:hypothetical protein
MKARKREKILSAKQMEHKRKNDQKHVLMKTYVQKLQGKQDGKAVNV